MHQDLYAANKAYYERNAGRYEAASWYYFNRYKATAVRGEIRHCVSLLIGRPALRVLEIGPGTGYLLGFLLEEAALPIRYTGIEHSTEMTRILTSRHAARCTEFSVISGSVTAGLLDNMHGAGEFDLVLGSSILHHLPDYEDVVRSLAGLIAPGGLMYFVREPIHRDECATPGVLSRVSEYCFRKADGLLMTPVVRKRLWPAKVKAEDASAIAIQMFRDGVTTRIFRGLENGGFRRIAYRRYNRRVSSFFSFLENKWCAPLRKDIFGNTLYSICLQKEP